MRSEPDDSSEDWARLARAAANNARVQSDGLDVYYGDPDLRRIALANAKRDLDQAIRSASAENASDTWIVDALLAGDPGLDALDAWMRLLDVQDAPRRRAELLDFLLRLQRGELDQEDGGW